MEKFYTWRKRWLPTSLFGRTLLIMVLPVLLVQGIGTLLFFERHWDNVTRYMAMAAAGEVALITNRYEALPASRRQAWLDSTMSTLGMYVRFERHKDEESQPLAPTKQNDSVLKDLQRQLSGSLNGRAYVVDWEEGRDNVRVFVEVKGGELQFTMSKKRLTSPTARIILIANILLMVVVLAIATLFLRNQVRPIVSLARAADRFGRGMEMPDFSPHGAREVRLAAHAFLTMKERIQRMMDSRTEMLAAISHDLRTPLSRMKLQLEMLPGGVAKDGLAQDVREMEGMVGEYLDFVRGSSTEQTEPTNPAHLLREVVARYRTQKAPIDVVVDEVEEVEVPLRPLAIKRAVSNLINNALRYGNRCFVRLVISPLFVSVIVEDDGPGIPAAEREAAFLPFKRGDESRNQDEGGSAGLGLSIVREVVHGHGGQIHLDDSPMGGLRATLVLPRG